jgi:hypothetical protein
MSKLICPHCGSFTAFSPAQIRGEGVLLDKSSDEYTHWGEVQISAVVPNKYEPDEEGYAILVCLSCSNYFIAKREKYAGKDNWLAAYPIQHKPVASEIPEPIKSEFEEANLCFAVGAYKACVTISMIALESLWQQQKASGLNELRDRGIISPRLFDQATEIRLWARLVKHEPTFSETVAREEAEELLSYLEEILHDVYVRPTRSATLAEKRKQVKKGNKSETSQSSSQ